MFKATGDLDVADERINQLTALNNALIIELNGKQGKPRKRFVSYLAAGIGAILAPIPAVYYDHMLTEHHDKAVEAADYVMDVCSDGTIVRIDDEVVTITPGATPTDP